MKADLPFWDAFLMARRHRSSSSPSVSFANG